MFNWWESRRPTFHIVVGAAGLVTLTAINLIAVLPPLSMTMQVTVFLPGVLVYGVLANMFYSLGFVTEAVMQRAWHEETPRVGPALFRQGLVFSVGLTLLPIALMGINYGVHVLKWILS